MNLLITVWFLQMKNYNKIKKEGKQKDIHFLPLAYKNNKKVYKNNIQIPHKIII
jgi:hypothetical protein